MRTVIVAQKDPQLPKVLDVPEGADWVSKLRCLKPEAAETLCAAVITLYPHDGLPVRVYRRVVMAFDQLVGESAENAAVLNACVNKLNADFPVPFRERSESYRVAALNAISATPEFRFLQRTSVRYLYDDIEVWQAFGYEAASLHLGGYRDRGYDDLDWLPPVPPIHGV